MKLMTSLPPKVPLYRGSKLQVHNPSLDYFINRIKSKQYFSMIRFQIEYWRQLRIALQYLGHKGWHYPPALKKDQEFYDKIGPAMLDAWVKEQSYGRPWLFTEKIFADHVKFITKPKPNDFFLAASDRAWYFDDWPPPPHDAWSRWADTVIQGMLPPGETPWNSLVWRRWGHSGKIQRFFAELKDKTFCFVAPYYYKNFGEKLQLSNFHFIEIDYLQASLHLEKTYNQIIDKHKELRKNNEDIIYIVVGGAPGSWLVINLHGKLDNAFMIEIGRGLDPYYVYDSFIEEKGINMQFWGNWLKRFPPTWVKNHPELIR